MEKPKNNVKRHYGSDHNSANNIISPLSYIKLPHRVLRIKSTTQNNILKRKSYVTLKLITN